MTQLSPPTEKEKEDVGMLSAMMGSEVDSTMALRVLRKFNGDVEKAADAMLAGDRGIQDSTSTPKVVTTTPAQNLIDLTGDDNDEEMTRALQMSMETDQPNLSEATFGPSSREPDPNWAVVPTNTQQQLSHEDENLKQAIEASLAVPEENDENVELSDMLRLDGRPVALRADSPSLVYAALVVHALFHVPQMRQKLAKIESLQSGDPLTALVELFVNFELAYLSSLMFDETLLALGAVQSQMTSPPVDWSADFVQNISQLLDERMGYDQDPLISFPTGRIRHTVGSARPEGGSQSVHVVPVEASADPSCPNELIARLSAGLITYEEDGSMSHEGILKPPQIIVFTLRKGGAASASSSLDTFVYPKTLYMDQFLLENFQIVNAKRTREAEIRSLLIQLDQRKAELTTHDNRDAIKDLKTSLQYFENVAHVGDSPDRRASVASTAEKLRKVLLGLETAVEKINAEVEKLQNEIKSLFECPELQNHRYDLRVVLMHTGVSGRKQMYSYVQDRNGAWWKTLDHAVTEVTEVDVLTDPTGIHLGAGPYMLIYSRHVPQEQLLQPIQWPRQFVDTTNNNNEHFLKTLSPEMADKFRMAKGNGSEEPRIEDTGQSGKKRVTLSEGGKGSQDVSMMDLNAGN